MRWTAAVHCEELSRQEQWEGFEQKSDMTDIPLTGPFQRLYGEWMPDGAEAEAGRPVRRAQQLPRAEMLKVWPCPVAWM